jgi:S-ribosylhomocysteine lyase LuxS involved in autoinducer biosynthesis
MRDYTIDDIMNSKIEHPLGGYQSVLEVGRYEVSVVGGRQTNHGDFINTFELAIFDKNKNFVTKKLVASAEHDVVSWLDKEELMDIINQIP